MDDLLKQLVSEISETCPTRAKDRAQWERRQAKLAKYAAIPVERLSVIERNGVPQIKPIPKDQWGTSVSIEITPSAHTDPAFDKMREDKRRKFNEAVNRFRK